MTSETLVAGIDSSTQSTKIVLVRAKDGTVVDQNSAPHPPGTEVEPEAWWEALLQKADAGLLKRATAVGIGGQQHGMVALDSKDGVVRPALIWNDLRSAPQTATVIDHLLEQIARQHHTTRDTVRTWLQTAEVSVQPRTSREHRKHLDPFLFASCTWTGNGLRPRSPPIWTTTVHLVLRTLHEYGIPVRKGGPPPKRVGDPAKARLAALYDDPDVTALLHQHRIPARPMAGTITQRFPTPLPITRAFLTEA